jgi:hypothetical protein
MTLVDGGDTAQQIVQALMRLGNGKPSLGSCSVLFGDLHRRTTWRCRDKKVKCAAENQRHFYKSGISLLYLWNFYRSWNFEL